MLNTKKIIEATCYVIQSGDYKGKTLAFVMYDDPIWLLELVKGIVDGQMVSQELLNRADNNRKYQFEEERND